MKINNLKERCTQTIINLWRYQNLVKDTVNYVFNSAFLVYACKYPFCLNYYSLASFHSKLQLVEVKPDTARSSVLIQDDNFCYNTLIDNVQLFGLSPPSSLSTCGSVV